jgi:hypothetical protein
MAGYVQNQLVYENPSCNLLTDCLQSHNSPGQEGMKQQHASIWSKFVHEVYQLHLACERVHMHSMCWARGMAQTIGSDGQSISQLLFNPCGIIAAPQIIALHNLQAWHHKHEKRLYNVQSTQLTYHLLWDTEIDPLNQLKQTPIFLVLYMHSNRCLRNKQKPGHKLLLLLALNEHLVWGDAHVHVGESVSILLPEVVNQESHLSATN